MFIFNSFGASQAGFYRQVYTHTGLYFVEIYDENKANDLTIYSEQGVDKEYLTELVFSNLRKFDGNIRAYVFDNLKKKKTTALILNRESLPPKTELTKLLG